MSGSSAIDVLVTVYNGERFLSKPLKVSLASRSQIGDCLLWMICPQIRRLR